MTDEIPSSVIADVAFIGRSGGLVKALAGFRKPHHNVPDTANATTNAFLGKICATELAGEAEALFQAVRAGFGYKRKDLALELASPVARLLARDFSVEILYELEAAEPSRYGVVTQLRDLRDAALARGEPMTAVFARRFSEISFAFRKAASVEAVVDAIESLEGEGGLAVTYPSDCRECEISVKGVDARVRCTAASLEIVFSRASSPRELIAAFAEVRGAFGINRTLAALTA